MPNRQETYKTVRIEKNHPYYSMSSNGYIPEHRLIMAEKLGRPLLPNEIVRRKNKQKRDNSPENLEVMKRKDLDILTQYQNVVRISKIWNEREIELRKKMIEAGLEEHI